MFIRRLSAPLPFTKPTLFQPSPSCACARARACVCARASVRVHSLRFARLVPKGDWRRALLHRRVSRRDGGEESSGRGVSLPYTVAQFIECCTRGGGAGVVHFRLSRPLRAYIYIYTYNIRVYIYIFFLTSITLDRSTFSFRVRKRDREIERVKERERKRENQRTRI